MHEVLQPKPCFHGGAVYQIIGDDFSDLPRQRDVIDADVLDAWFEPSPKAVQALRDNLVWSLRSSPPVRPTGVERAISKSIDVSAANILCGAGSSNLIFLALRELLTIKSKVLILDPTYGEYSFLISQVIGCQLDSFQLCAEDNYKVNLDSLLAKINSQTYDLVILVNPNNPSGQFIGKANFIDALNLIPKSTLVWIDEAYIDYVDKSQSLSDYAAKSNNIIVCKSLSKVLALSGLRVAYIVANKAIVERLRPLTPPWSLSLPAQIILL
ncbi:MAG: histidinol-phosphate aminotransferase family protein, partial [Leptolyngbya sp.]|nr:histidinol-phosphate aminotransferase family protein [Candidatus Melainabacteria bacterium]